MRCQLKQFTLAAVFLHTLTISTSINAGLDFDVNGEGFHRSLDYKVDIEGLNQTGCFIALHILLPPEIYVNVDEIADLKRVGKTLACSEGETDVELFAEKAEGQNVTICTELKSSRTVLSLPVHQRYQFSQDNGGYVPLALPQPKLLIGCKDRLRDHRVSKIDLCSPCVDLALKWREIPYKMESVDKVWLIPVGNASYLTTVSLLTLLVTCLGAAAVLQKLLQLRTRSKINAKQD